MTSPDYCFTVAIVEFFMDGPEFYFSFCFMSTILQAYSNFVSANFSFAKYEL